MKIGIEPGIRALIFDVDGTLADSMPVHYDAWKEIVSPSPFFDYDRYLSLGGVPGYRILEMLNTETGSSFSPDDILPRKEEAFLRRINTIKPIEPLVSLVKSQYHRLPMAIGTGGRRHMAALTLRIIGLDHYFDVMVSADDVRHAKPDPETFLTCARLMGIPPAECLVFEDADPGIEAARNASMKYIDVRTLL